MRPIPVDKIRESIVTLRTVYDKEQLKELSESLADQGQLQNIVVQATEDGFYELVIGSRRLQATKLRGERHIVAYVIEKRSAVELILIALAENLHRSDLNPFEEAQAFLRLMKEFGLSMPEVAKGIRRPESYIRTRLQILSMPEEVVRMVSEKTLPLSSVRVLARLPTGEDQISHARAMIKHHLSQSDLSTRVQQELEEPERSDRQSYELTSVKLSARIGQFSKFLGKIPRRMKVHRMNTAERKSVADALNKLKVGADVLLEMINSNSVMTIPRSVATYGEADNQGQEWTTKEIRRIHAPNRPSDQELAVELGRTVAAIRVMRSHTSEKTG
ncbi:MAG TPA: ParB/RepB/Spo0J family partition protein [Candidatus Paceibacterota bacterium]|nr:ParB/RepB/Spo0J family partition protein [Candidatus Paceibacterota bacterium]